MGRTAWEVEGPGYLCTAVAAGEMDVVSDAVETTTGKPHRIWGPSSTRTRHCGRSSPADPRSRGHNREGHPP
jgi:hypothetical protein